jgi:Glu-tRNA(Gln) amidotransferase subunit E-like FAD-binding protein
VDYDAINDPTENEDIEDQQIKEIFGIEQTNPRVGTLVENVETYDEENNDIENVIDEMIDELNNEVIPEGEEIINNISVETVELQRTQ